MRVIFDRAGAGPVTELYAWVVVPPSGDEGLLIADLPEPYGFPMAMVGSDREMIASLEPIAQRARDFLGCPIKLMRFTGLQEVRRL